MKMTYNGRRPENIKSGIPLLLHIRSSSNFKLKLWGPSLNLKLLEMNTSSNGRRPQIIKIELSQHLLIRSHSNLKLKIRGPNPN
jgi:hypothetical protein